MITCQYCGFSHEAFQPTCAACGAPLRAGQPVVTEKADIQDVIEKIRRYCRQTVRMFGTGVFLDGDTIPEKKMRSIKKSFRIFPEGKAIYFYCDTSPLNNGARGFMICEDGIYWQNGWFNPTNRNFLAWAKFKEREIALKRYDLDLGAGDMISLAGLGRKVLFPIVEGIFRRVQIILQQDQ